MDNLDDSENNAKISDSAYSNSCSNSQSRRSHSSKSTHSGSNSSGSSGYGGKPSTSGSSNNLGQPPKKDKEAKKKKAPLPEPKVTDVIAEVEPRVTEPVPVDVPQEETIAVVPTPPPVDVQTENGAENMELVVADRSITKDQEVAIACNSPVIYSSMNISRPPVYGYSEGFSCVISMHDGVIMYTTPSLTTTLGFPKHMWIGRSFIDFFHPKDRSTFASQITNGLAGPKVANGNPETAESPANSVSTMVCRIRRYRGLATGFGVKDRTVSYMPILLKLTFKNISDEEGKVIYLVIQATPLFSAFKIPYEVVNKVVPFVIRHAANGNIEYVDPESVPYLGHLPQDLVEKNALMLYHPDDLAYLRQVYETIVKEGGVPRSKPYRMMTQNGGYIKLETEWSSFINPWSRKLEFVIGKHHIIEGPANPDVFYSPESEKPPKVSEEEKNKAYMLRENIVRIMNEVLTKSAEVAKQQMSKRCQDLASFMESLMEEPPKTDDELRLEIQDPDHSYYERDSVMLGGISPHHDYLDSKSSIETTLSYNQLNYNENLQRYFDSHQPNSFEDYNTVAGENILGLKNNEPVAPNFMSPIAHHSGDSEDLTSSSDSPVMKAFSPHHNMGDYQQTRLTETLLTKHNAEMEKELMKLHRETRSSSKGEREKSTNETRKKKKEHLARCNASFQPTTAGTTLTDNQVKGVKRSATKHAEPEASTHKQQCTTARQARRRHRTLSTSAAVAHPSATVPTTVENSSRTRKQAMCRCVAPAYNKEHLNRRKHLDARPLRYRNPNPWPPTSAVSNVNTFILGVAGIPPQMSLMSPVPGMPGMIPMYYAPAPANPNMPQTATPGEMPFNNNNAHFQQVPPMQCMMYGQPMYGTPFMYSPINPQVSYPMQQPIMSPLMAPSMTPSMPTTLNPLGLTTSNYEASTEAVRETTPQDRTATNKKLNRLGNSEDKVDKTDGESSYSSFYSSFFKTESGSAEDSDARKNYVNKFKRSRSPSDGISSNYHEYHKVKKVARRKMEPPWMEQVCVTSELIYKYQILTKTMDEVLIADKQKIATFEQPSLVNDQLDQLYMDLQLEGVATRLTLEEDITSSSSSGEETSTSMSRGLRRKREYSKLVMIYEEDAPLPPPASDSDMGESMPSCSRTPCF